MLKGDEAKVQRAQYRQSFIIVQENIQELDRFSIIEKGQIVRKEKLIEKIFKEAGLEVFDSDGPRDMGHNILDLKTWALYPSFI